MPKKAVIIGSGFAGLSAASFLAKAGWQVHVVEKHNMPGGRARRFQQDGFTFDMGPSWYWMPDIFERYFAQFGKKPSDYYELERLDPSYRIYWHDNFTDIPADYQAFREMVDSLEPGAASRLDDFLKEAAFKYEVGVKKLVFKPGRSLLEFVDMDLIKGIFRLDVFHSIKSHIRKYFSHPKLIQIMEFPILFLGALPQNTPALYSLMNYADIKLGTWYPKGGMYSVVKGMHRLAEELGVIFHFNEEIISINLEKSRVKSLTSKSGNVFDADVVIGSADYHHIETKLLDKAHRSYSDAYWQSRDMAPGSLIYYVALNKKIPDLKHHTLFFDQPFEVHANDIYADPQWPTKPLFYLSASSVTDPTQAPEGCENIFFLIPVAAGLKGDDEQLRMKYFDLICDRFKSRMGIDIREHIVFMKTYANSDFESDYHAFKGNAYGLANTLLQTAILKPGCVSKKVKNLFYAGQLTVPGPGVPPSLISGEVVAGEVVKNGETGNWRNGETEKW